MTISTTASRISHNGNGVTTGFAFPYRFMANADLTVVRVSALGVETTLVLNTDYTVTGADADAGGTVTCTTAPAVGERLVIYRDMDATQEVDYITGDAFPAETHERALDRLTMLVQQVNDGVARAVKVSETSTISPDDLVDSINASVVAAAASATAADASADDAAASALAASGSAAAAAASAASIDPSTLVAKAGSTMTGTLTLPTLKASSSAGLILQNSAGTQVADFGPGPGTGVTFAGQVNASAFSGSGASLTEVGPRLSTSVTASGTAVDFTGIPSWAKRVNVMFSGLSTNGSATVQCQIGTSGGIQTTGYVGNTSTIPNSTPASTALSTGFGLNANMAASATLFGSFSVSMVDSANGIWAANGVLARGDAVANYLVSGAKTLSGVLDRIRITANGTDTFDAGTINVSWE